MNIDIFIALLVGAMLGANFGFVIAGLFGGNHDEDMPLNMIGGYLRKVAE